MPSLTVPANLEQLARVHDYIRKEVPDAYTGILSYVLLAAEELLVNVFTHAYKGQRGQIDVDCRLVQRDGRENLCLTIKDWGQAFDPFFEAPAPDLGPPIEERPIGGLGVYLIKSITAHVNYTRQDDTNIVTLYFENKP